MHNADGAARSLLLVSGSNSGGQLGLGHGDDSHVFVAARCRAGASASSTSTFPPDGTRVVHLSSGANHSLALLDRHDAQGSRVGRELWATGENGQGQLGAQEPRAAEAQQDVWVQLDWESNLGLASLLARHNLHDTYSLSSVTCAWEASFLTLKPADRRNDDLLVVLGCINDFGQLGLPRGQADSTVSNLLPLKGAFGADAPAALRIAAVGTGLRHVVALCIGETQDGATCSAAFIGWGASRHGQLGAAPTATRAHKFAPGSLVVWEPQLIERWESVPRPAGAQDPEPQVVAGKTHTVGLLPAHLVAVDGVAQAPSGYYLVKWGGDRRGPRPTAVAGRMAGSSSITAAVVQLASNWDSTLILYAASASEQLRIVGSGSNTKAQLGRSITDVRDVQEARFPNDRTFRAEGARFVSGSEHSLLLAEGEVWGWGWNEHGNLGTEPGAQATTEQEADHRLPCLLWHSGMSERYSATNVWAGCGTSFILLEREES